MSLRIFATHFTVNYAEVVQNISLRMKHSLNVDVGESCKKENRGKSDFMKVTLIISLFCLHIFKLLLTNPPCILRICLEGGVS